MSRKQLLGWALDIGHSLSLAYFHNGLCTYAPSYVRGRGGFISVHLYCLFIPLYVSSHAGHRNVYVGVHMPHSHSRHRSHHRHKRKHHSRHGNGHGHGSRHHREGKENGEDSPPMGTLTPPQGGGEVDGTDGYAEITSLQPSEQQRQQRQHGRLSDVTTPSASSFEGWGQPRYAKSLSLPAGFLPEPRTIPVGKK